LPAGQYLAYFRIKVPTTTTDSLELLKLDVASDGGSKLLGVRYVRGTDFAASHAYQDVAVDFELLADEMLEFRAESIGRSDLWVDQVRVFDYPRLVSPHTTWTLPAREGLVTVTVRFVDRAANLSAGTPLTFMITDTSPPEAWRQFQCLGPTCTVQVRDTIAGLNPKSAAYRYSLDSSVTWSKWISTTCSGTDGSHRWETIAAPSFVPTTPLTSETVLIQFGIADVAVAGNWSTSPSYQPLMWSVYFPLVLKP
jgi:hypothetical protein